MSGLEGEVKGSFLKGLRYFANFSYLIGTQKGVNTDVMFIPSLLLNAGFNYTIDKFTFSPYLQFVGNKKGNLVTPGLPAVEVASYALLNFNIEYKICKDLNIMLIGKNLTDNVYFYPEYIRLKIAEVPGGPGRAVYLKVSYSFWH